MLRLLPPLLLLLLLLLLTSRSAAFSSFPQQACVCPEVKCPPVNQCPSPPECVSAVRRVRVVSAPAPSAPAQPPLAPFKRRGEPPEGKSEQWSAVRSESEGPNSHWETSSTTKATSTATTTSPSKNRAEAHGGRFFSRRASRPATAAHSGNTVATQPEATTAGTTLAITTWTAMSTTPRGPSPETLPSTVHRLADVSQEFVESGGSFRSTASLTIAPSTKQEARGASAEFDEYDLAEEEAILLERKRKGTGTEGAEGAAEAEAEGTLHPPTSHASAESGIVSVGMASPTVPPIDISAIPGVDLIVADVSVAELGGAASSSSTTMPTQTALSAVPETSSSGTVSSAPTNTTTAASTATSEYTDDSTASASSSLLTSMGTSMPPTTPSFSTTVVTETSVLTSPEDSASLNATSEAVPTTSYIPSTSSSSSSSSPSSTSTSPTSSSSSSSSPSTTSPSLPTIPSVQTTPLPRVVVSSESPSDVNPDISPSGYRSSSLFGSNTHTFDPTKCNSDEWMNLLFKEMQENDATSSKQRISEQLGPDALGTVSVLCSKTTISFRLVAARYCQMTAGDVTCLLFEP